MFSVINDLNSLTHKNDLKLELHRYIGQADILDDISFLQMYLYLCICNKKVQNRNAKIGLRFALTSLFSHCKMSRSICILVTIL